MPVKIFNYIKQAYKDNQVAVDLFIAGFLAMIIVGNLIILINEQAGIYG